MGKIVQNWTMYSRTQVFFTFHSSYGNSISGNRSSLKASHPLHVFDETSSASPSSFIPFCAYQTQLGISEPFTNLTNTSFPLCKSFVPETLDAQLCYNIKLDMKSETGREKGLALVLDMNEDRSVSFDFPDKVDVQEDDSKMTLDDGLEKDDIAGKVHVKLLAPFEGTAEGSYGFRSVKNIKGTKDFQAMSEDDRDCTRG